MSYITDKFNAGEVHIEFDVCGWLFDNGEFRPLMNDAMEELREAGLVTDCQVFRTAIAHNAYQEAALEQYVKAQEEFWTKPEYEDARNEQLAEMRAAFGPGETVVNALTGRKHKV